MTESTASAPGQKLQPAPFKLVRDDGRIAVYRALIPDTAEPTTTFSLTVTAASPGQGPEREALLRFLTEMRILFWLPAQQTVPEEFAVLEQFAVPEESTVPEDSDDAPPDPFAPKTEVMIEPGLYDTAREGVVDVAFVAQTTAAGSEDTVNRRYGKVHRWTRAGNRNATVNPVSGSGFIRPPNAPRAPRPVSQNNYYSVGARTFFVGTASSMIYFAYGNVTRQ
jgi:hypothetical protein